jgi:hypothetical protein
MKRIRGTTFFLLYGLISLLISCASEESILDATGYDSYVNLLVSASSNSINEYTETGEDRVTEIRILAFDQTGAAVYNSILNFPSGFNSASEAVKFKPGLYDFYFIANESVDSGFASAIASVTNVSQLHSDPRFIQLQYNPDFYPDTSTGSGRFLMSACYKGIRVYLGGTETSPDPLVLPTPSVELIRSLAKVQVTFRKKTSGINVPPINSIQLQNVPQSNSVPPADNYYTGPLVASNIIDPTADFNYNNDSIGSVIFYVPEFLNSVGGTAFTEININNRLFPILSDENKVGLIAQRRSITSLSDSSIIRNYHYIINAYMDTQGGVYLQTGVVPWNKSSYVYMFQDPDQNIDIPPVDVTDSTVIVPTSCGKIEIRSTNEYLQQGLMGAFGDVVNYWDPNVQGPNIYKGQPPYYCEKKYGPGWRLINSCEMMSFLALFDQTYRIWQSNTWQGIGSGLPLYPIPFRQQAQDLLEKLTGADMSKYTMSDTEGGDNFGSEKLGIIDDFFTPQDIVVTLKEYPGGWPYPAPPAAGIENWYPMEVVHQVKGYWYSGYLPYDDPANYDKILYQRFERYSFSSTVSRCVRSVE